MSKFKFNGKMLILLILACSFFNSIIRWDSNVGFFSLVITFFFIAVMINYTVFKLEVKNPDKKVRGALIFYFALTGSAGLINYVIRACEIVIPDIYSKVLRLITAPYEGLNFVLRFEQTANVAALLFGILFIILVFNLTDDDLEEFRKMQEEEENKEIEQEKE